MRAIDSIMAGGDRPDNEQVPPTQADERARIIKSYDNVQILDTLIMSGSDTLRLHIKYFCLKDTKLIIPKRYEFTDKPPKDFVTHPFAINVTMSANGDTVLNKKFTVATLSPFFEDPFEGALKKYGSIIDIPVLSKQHREAHTVILNFSVSIPTTDLGVPFTLIIKTDGTYTGHSY